MTKSTVIIAIFAFAVLAAVGWARGGQAPQKGQPISLTASSGAYMSASVVPAHSSVVEAKLWIAAHSAKALTDALDQAVSGGLKLSNDATARLGALKKNLDEVKRVGGVPLNPGGTANTGSGGGKARCVCTYDPGSQMLYVNRLCPVHGGGY